MRKLLLLLVLLLPAACAKKPDDAWLGYAEGDEAMISAPQPGWVVSLKTERGQVIHRGDVLFVLDDTRELAGRDQAAAALVQAQAALAQAQAGQAQARSSLTQEQANLAYTRTELARQDRLAQQGIGTPTQRDAARNAFQQSEARIGQLQAQVTQTGAQIEQTRAQIAQMQASLGSASYSLSQRQIVAETEGPVQDIFFRQGEYVPASTPVLSILPPANIYVRFFVPEGQLQRARLGGRVRITCDGCKPMDAIITFIAQQQEFTPPVIFSNGNREKLVFKMEARLPAGLPLHPGQPVEVRPL